MRYTTALVTGASRGIGRAVVAAFRSRDMHVHALARPSPALDSTASELGAEPHAVDLADTDALHRVVSGLDVDVVVNNAGVLPEVVPFQESDAAGIDAMVDVNLRAALHVVRLVLPAMVARNRGHVFFVGSIAGKRPAPNLAVYSATKAGLQAFAEGIKCDLLGTDVRVTAVLPGRVRTSLYDDIYEDPSEVLYDGVQPVAPEDVASLIVAALDLPPNVDVTAVEVMPTRQIYGGSSVAKE